jgi:protein involved in polysaccharide export with SLBB domain
VTRGPAIILPTIREVPLKGLLRAELAPHIEAHLKRFLVNPVIEATALMRIWIDGSVNAPGVYMVPAEAVVTDVLMHAGGLGENAGITAIRIERGGERIWEGEALQRAITEGKTLDQLSLKAGDRIVVPRESSGGVGGLRTILLTASSIVLLLTQLF